MIVANLAWPSPWVLLVGSFTSTFGAALQCLCSKYFVIQFVSLFLFFQKLIPG